LKTLDRFIEKSSFNRFLNTLDMRANRTVMRARPFNIQLETTTKCNLACIMCSRQKYHGAGKHLDRSILERVLAEVVPYAQDLCISSFGEPLLYPEIGKLLEVARRYPKLELGMYTNLLLVDEEMARGLVGSRVSYMNVSIDGATRETYEKVRRGGKWDRMIGALETLNRVKRERRSRHPLLNLTVVGLTVNVHEIPLFVELAKRYGFASLVVDANAYIDDEEMCRLSLVHAKREANAMFRAGYARALELGINSNLDKTPFAVTNGGREDDRGVDHTSRPRGLVWMLRRIRRAAYLRWYLLESIYRAAGKSWLLFAAMVSIKLYDRFLRRYFSQPRRTLHVFPNAAPPARCGNPWIHAHIKVEGKVYACCYNHTVMGDLTKQSFDEIWNGPKYRSLRQAIATGKYWASCRGAPCNWIDPGASEQYGARIKGLPETLEMVDGLGTQLNVRVTNTGRMAWTTGRNDDQGAPESEFAIAYRLFQHDVSGGLRLVEEGTHVRIPRTVHPGETIEMELPILAIETPGEYAMKVDMVHEHVTWFGERGDSAVNLPVRVKAFRRGELRIDELPSRIATATEVTVDVTLINTSEAVWPAARPHQVCLSYHWLSSEGETAVHDGLRTPLESDLRPGESAPLKARLLAPPDPGSYRLQWDLVQEGVSWFGMGWSPTQEITVFRRGELRVHGLPERLRAAMQVAVGVVLTNTSEATWPAAGANPVHLAYHWLTDKDEMAVHDGVRTSLERDVAPGASVTLSARVLTPPEPGHYRLKWDLVQENIAWFRMDWPSNNVEVT
jgi:MoaA/NifB/PqqE/SkfB family radical SAM enzyme